jgi:alpha-methylacyl-CoA racemase
MCGLFEARRSGNGQVIDAAMIDGAASLLSKQFGLFAAGLVNAARGTNMLDGGAYFYDVYECAGGGYIAIGAIEDKFHRELLDLLSIGADALPRQHDQEQWPQMRARLQARFLTKTRDEWCELLQHSDACATPVLALDEAATHPHAIARSSFVTIDGVWQPAPAPRFLRTPAAQPRSARDSREPADRILARWKAFR